MLKRRSKHFALLLVLTMLATMFVGVGAASAATSYDVNVVPTITADGTVQNLGAVLVRIDTLDAAAAAANSAIVRLPADLTLSATPAADNLVSVVRDDGATSGLPATFAPTRLNDRELRVDFPAVTASYGVTLSIALNNVLVAANKDEGPVDVVIEKIAGQLPNGLVTVAKVSGGACTVSILDTVTLTGAGTAAMNTNAPNGEIAITINEDSRAGVMIGTGTLKFKLPKGFTWSTARSTVMDVGTGLASGVLTINATTNGDRLMTIDRAAAAPRGIYRIYADITVDEEEAAYGDVDISVSGRSTVSPNSLNVGKYSDYEYVIEVENPDKTIIAGRAGDDAEISAFRIKEDVRDTILNNRTVNMTLPDGCEWVNIGIVPLPAPDITTTTKAGGLNFAPFTAVPGKANKVRSTVINPGVGKGDVEVEATIRVAVNYTGPVTITFDGSAGLNDTITVANVIAPLKATAESVEVKIGMQDQAGADIEITELQKETLISTGTPNLSLRLPAGVSFAKLPTVESAELTLGTPTRAAGPEGTRNNQLNIPIRGQSDKPATIKISNLYYSLDRTVPEGDMVALVIGAAVDQVGITNRTVAASVVAAKCVTPAPGEKTTSKTVFTINSSSFDLNGVEQTMEVAPYIKDSRTFMPIRYVAYAMGIDDSNILWDGVKQTVTLMKGDKVVQLQIGSTTLLINGAAVTMDVAPEISNSRTMLPISFVANAFGASVAWDAATQQVTIE